MAFKHPSSVEAGSILASHDDKTDPGLWFVLYSDEEGALAFDLTTEHPDFGYQTFGNALNFKDTNAIAEKIVLMGGPERSDDALVILHEARAANADSNAINDQFAFLSYNFVSIPGKPPMLTTPDNRPSRIALKKPSGVLVAMGYRVFDRKMIADELNAHRWICLPATTDLVFNTGRHERRAKLINQMN